MGLFSFFRKKEAAKPIKKLNSLVSEQLEKAELVHCYIDMFGNNYYMFPEPQTMSVIRFTAASEAAKYAEFNLSKERLVQLCDDIINALNKSQPAIKDIALAVHEIKTSAEYSAERTTLLNLACVYFVRQDENPNAFDSEIQKQKVECWEKDSDAMGFFLDLAWKHTKAYQNLLDTDSAKSLQEMNQKTYNSRQFFR